MEKQKLGKTEMIIAPLALGCNVFGWTVDQKRAFELLDAFVDYGFNLLDTADIYSTWVVGNKGGESETIIGHWLKTTNKRDKIVLASKVGMEVQGKKGLNRSHIIHSVEESLKRLQTETIDLYQAHEDDPNTPLAETLEAFDLLIKQGKIRAIGASNYEAKRLKEALKTSRQLHYSSFTTLQPYYNLYDREGFEKELESVCLEEGLGVISYFSLAKGFLSGKYRSPADFHKSPRGERLGRYFDQRGFAILQALDEISEQLKIVPATVALAWLIHRKSITAPIVSATSLPQLAELAKATTLSLSEENIQKLNNFCFSSNSS